MHADSFFRMGATHAVCQDYADSGAADGVPYAILADGCSGSQHTDFGARFLARATIGWLSELRRAEFPTHEIIAHAASMARVARLPIESLDATLLVATLNDYGDNVFTYQTGDGVVVARRRDTEKLEYFSREYSGGMPYYLSYLLSGSARARLERYEQEVRVKSNVNNICARVSPWLLRREFRKDEYDLVALLSDGAEAFHRSTGEMVPLESVLRETFAIKSFTGQFFGRRCARFLGTFCKEQGWKHADDFSVAGIYLGDES